MFNQNNNGNQYSGNIPFNGPQAIFQPGFAGTDAHQVRQQNSHSRQNQNPIQ